MLFPHKNKLRNCCFYLRICWHQLSLMLMLGWSLINEIVSYHVYKSEWNINILFAEILSWMMLLCHVLSVVLHPTWLKPLHAPLLRRHFSLRWLSVTSRWWDEDAQFFFFFFFFWVCYSFLCRLTIMTMLIHTVA